MALGATLSTSTPDMGPGALLGRFEQRLLSLGGAFDVKGASGDVLVGVPQGTPVLSRSISRPPTAIPL